MVIPSKVAAPATSAVIVGEPSEKIAVDPLTQDLASVPPVVELQTPPLLQDPFELPNPLVLPSESQYRSAPQSFPEQKQWISNKVQKYLAGMFLNENIFDAKL
jgi:hypothetical protein